jgi:hypothetical protein
MLTDVPATARPVNDDVRFVLQFKDELVARVGTIDGIEDAIVATEEVRLDPHVYVPGLHVARIAAESSEWFAFWRSTGGKRDLTIHHEANARTIVVIGAFIAAWNDGTWYDLVIDAAFMRDTHG